MAVVSPVKLCNMLRELPKWMIDMDETDNRLIALLRRDARASLSELAIDLKVTRATVRARMDRLVQSGQIAGFTVMTRADVAPNPVRGLMMLEIAGRGAERIIRSLRAIGAVSAVHTTNGAWDLIAEIGTETLEEFDEVLTRIRKFDGVNRSETNLLLTSRH